MALRKALEFYKKCGISEVAYDIVHVEVNLGEVNVEAQVEHLTSCSPESGC